MKLDYRLDSNKVLKLEFSSSGCKYQTTDAEQYKKNQNADNFTIKMWN